MPKFKITFVEDCPTKREVFTNNPSMTGVELTSHLRRCQRTTEAETPEEALQKLRESYSRAAAMDAAMGCGFQPPPCYVYHVIKIEEVNP